MISSLQPKRPVAGGGGNGSGASQKPGGSRMQRQQRRESAITSEQSDSGEVEKTQTERGEAGQHTSETNGNSSVEAEEMMEKQTGS